MADPPQSLQTEHEDEEEEEVEPLLKYNRLGNDLKKVLSADPASCLAVHSKFLAIGSHGGVVHIFDHEGNHISSKQFRSHEITVNQISIDDDGEYIASCSDDGKTVINGFIESEHEQVITFDRPVKAVAIDPRYTKHTKQFVTGDDKLIITEKTSGFFGKGTKTHTVHQGEGMIRCIKWSATYIAWSNSVPDISGFQDNPLSAGFSYAAWVKSTKLEREQLRIEGVKIYDTASKQRITFIKFNITMEARSRPDLYKGCLCWKDESTLLIGFGDQVQICKISTRPGNDVRDLPAKYAEITARFKTDYFIAGIAPSTDGNIVLLTYSEAEVKQEGKEVINPRPHVRLIVPGMGTHEEKSNDALSIRNYRKYRCDLYGLEWVPGEEIFFIVSPADVIKANPRTEDDHIQWLIKHNKFDEALAVVKRSRDSKISEQYERIGHMFIDHLCDLDRYEEAASRSVSLLGNNREIWEYYFYKFNDRGKIQEIAQYLPREEPTLSPAVYEIVLYTYLQTDVPVGYYLDKWSQAYVYAYDKTLCVIRKSILQHQISSFLQLLKTWQKDIYSANTIVNTVISHIKSYQEKLTKEHVKLLYECLAILYTNQSNYVEALSVYLKLKHEDVFQFIHKHNLFASINQQIVLLMEFNTDKALDLLMKNIESVPPQKVVPQLTKNSTFQFKYLDQLMKKYPHECTPYHNKMVFLYAEHSSDRLLTFLKRADGYDQTAALKFCEQRDLTKEMAYLMGKMGNHRQALQLIVSKLQDVEYAIQFCKEHNYDSLWHELIDYSLQKPKFIKALLDNIGTHIDPLMLILKIPEDIDIPGLRNSLVKILQDYNLQISLREDCQKILSTDTLNLLSQHVKQKRRGLAVEDSARCGVCRERVISSDMTYAEDLCLFYCHHIFHQDCLPYSSTGTCIICNAQKRGPGIAK